MYVEQPKRKENEEKEKEKERKDKTMRKQVNRRAALRKIRGAEYSQVRCTAPPAVFLVFGGELEVGGIGRYGLYELYVLYRLWGEYGGVAFLNNSNQI